METTQTNSGQARPAVPERPAGKPAAEGRSWEGSPERSVEIVTVSIFDREYHFKSNRPELVREIADLISRLHRQVRATLPGLPHLTDYPAHVAFSLARDLIKSRREIEDLKATLARCESRLSDLAALLDLSLEA
ncbi:MAG: cell division protein ZapA [Deltaproteobacteria bacterium]|jgi:hypothetical protein|nr:cell division protein ZapA [Deltaproteobacteria bacterium]